MRNEFEQNGREENSCGIPSETLMVPIIVNRIDNGGIFIQLYVRFIIRRLRRNSGDAR